MALTARKIAVTVNSRQHQGISVPKDKKIRTVFVAQYGSDVFCSGNTNKTDYFDRMVGLFFLSKTVE